MVPTPLCVNLLILASLLVSFIYIYCFLLVLFFFSIQIARRLLGKILIDLRNTREEAISVAELKCNEDQQSTSKKSEKEDTDYQLKLSIKNDDVRRTSTTSDISMDQDDDDDKETKYRLDPK